MAYMLSLFSDAEMKGLALPEPSPRSHSVESDEESAVPAEASILDPCKSCEFKGLCEDDCAAHLYPLDAPWAYGTRFHNLQEFILMKKHYGWL